MAPLRPAFVLAFVVAAGCRAPGPPAFPPKECPDRDRMEAERKAAPPAPPSPRRFRPVLLTVDAGVGRPVRKPIEIFGGKTFVELCAKEVVASGPDRPARIHCTIRLCTEDGTTDARAIRWSKETGGEVIPPDRVREVDSGGEFHQSYSYTGGTGWEIDLAAETIDDATVRFTVRGEYLH